MAVQLSINKEDRASYFGVYARIHALHQINMDQITISALGIGTINNLRIRYWHFYAMAIRMQRSFGTPVFGKPAAIQFQTVLAVRLTL